ncbi:hypothetical protein [Candidatus Mycobacterium methanotrophicum]|uniref:Uncharacterized protein n=1 Tax=Candidatus Mycobacterium methanotrophicum TaxID=2943498 RepID=A0ABY4QJF0_9MYCO|nr:hypothetical protein [Candidatus Mycobacterium methanotrophicum]UQX11142.1 hypothetical protein M5I08_00730 [Candidatus Mycobacterium methanotrophicum]
MHLGDRVGDGADDLHRRRSGAHHPEAGARQPHVVIPTGVVGHPAGELLEPIAMSG